MEQRPVRGQAAPVRTALEQGRAQRALQELHLLGHRRLRHPHLISSGRETTESPDCFEDSKPLQLLDLAKQQPHLALRSILDPTSGYATLTIQTLSAPPMPLLT